MNEEFMKEEDIEDIIKTFDRSILSKKNDYYKVFSDNESQIEGFAKAEFLYFISKQFILKKIFSCEKTYSIGNNSINPKNVKIDWNFITDTHEYNIELKNYYIGPQGTDEIAVSTNMDNLMQTLMKLLVKNDTQNKTTSKYILIITNYKKDNPISKDITYAKKIEGIEKYCKCINLKELYNNSNKNDNYNLVLLKTELNINKFSLNIIENKLFSNKNLNYKIKNALIEKKINSLKNNTNITKESIKKLSLIYYLCLYMFEEIEREKNYEKITDLLDEGIRFKNFDFSKYLESLKKILTENLKNITKDTTKKKEKEKEKEKEKIKLFLGKLILLFGRITNRKSSLIILKKLLGIRGKYFRGKNNKIFKQPHKIISKRKLFQK